MSNFKNKPNDTPATSETGNHMQSHNSTTKSAKDKKKILSVEDLPPIMCEKEVAAFLGWTTKTLQTHRQQGTGIEYKKMKRSVRYAREDVIKFMNEGHVKTINLRKVTQQ